MVSGSIDHGLTQGLCEDLACASEREVFSSAVVLDNPSGLHTRPAARLAALAKTFQADSRLITRDREASVKSMIALINLGARNGDTICFRASGVDAETAVPALVELLEAICIEERAEAASTKGAALSPVAAEVEVGEAGVGGLAGIPASPGLAIGRTVRLRASKPLVEETVGSVAEEHQHFEKALLAARQEIDNLKRQSESDIGVQILSAHLELLSDGELLGLARDAINGGKSAGFAWQSAFSTYAATLEGQDNTLIRERAGDVRDVGRRVLNLISGNDEAKAELPPGTILIAEDLTPSDTVALDRSRVIGFCTATGGATSHVAILARSLDLPAICGIDERALEVADGTLAIVDGGRGMLRLDPAPDEIAATEARIAAADERRRQDREHADLPAATRDGHRVEVVANISSMEDAKEAVAVGAEGVGLLRSEFLFENRKTPPRYEEQLAAYRGIARIIGPERPLVIRTLDVGGDKPLPYLPLPKEDNPFLGLRGIRACLDRPDIFREQIRAILGVTDMTRLHVMFPMISSIEELRKAKQILDEERRGRDIDVKIGIMVEVPSAAVMADQFAREVDFFSIGTNDLTQYTLAMDRGHAKLAKQADGLHPSVLRMIAMTVKGAHKSGKWVGVCGGIASDVLAIPALVGLGVDELSVSVPAIASIKATISRLSQADCVALAEELLEFGTTAEVRARLGAFIVQD